MEPAKTQLEIVKNYWEIFYRRKWFFIASFVPIVAAAFLMSFTLTLTYKSTTTILVERQKVPEAYVRSTVNLDISEKLRTIKTQILSRTKLQKIIDDYDLFHYEEKKPGIVAAIQARLGIEKKPPSREEIIARMRNDIEINVKRRDSFSVSYVGTDPEITMRVTNALASIFIEENLKIREQRAEGTSEFLTDALEKAKEVLEQRESAVRDFKERLMGALPEQLDANLRTLDRLQIKLQTLNDSMINAKDKKAFIEEQLRSFTAVGGEINSLVAQTDPVMSELIDLRNRLSLLRATFKDTYPDVIIFKNRIKEVEKILANRKQSNKENVSEETTTKIQNPEEQRLRRELKIVSAEIESLRIKEVKNKKQIEVFEKRVEETPANEQKLTGLIRDYSMMQGNYQSLLGKKLNAQLSENMEKRQKGEQFRILDSANLPEKPYGRAKRKMRLLGLMAGGVVGIGLILLVEFLTPAFRKPEDFDGLTDIPVFVTIPLFSKKAIKQ